MQMTKHFNNEQLIKEEYTGIRPAPGYPACPDHTEKYKLIHFAGGKKQQESILPNHWRCILPLLFAVGI